MTMIAERLGHILDEDFNLMIERLTSSTPSSDRSSKGTEKGTRRGFADYLMSVTSQAVGLRASFAPYNCSKEQMLAYLMDLFQMNQAQVASMLASSKSAPRMIEEYSWRPEIVFTVGQPVFYHKEREYIRNMTVRVYLFNDSPVNPSDSGNTSLGAKRLHRYFQRIKLDPAIMVRPKEQMLEELRFTKTGTPRSSISTESRNSEHSLVGGRLNISRRDIRSKGSTFLRFEFWIKSSAKNISSYNNIIRSLRRKNFCCSSSDKSAANNFRDGEEFYGFINIKINQVPAYAIKLIYPILSLKEQRVNTSEISLEFKNKDIVDSTDERQLSTPSIANSRPQAKSTDQYIINHIRLYVNCLIFQLLSLRKSFEAKGSKDFDAYLCNVTLENLLYLPAHTLINQHRLRVNLEHLEDQSLRRSAILLMIVQIGECVCPASVRSILSTFLLVMITVVEHEYTIAHRLTDRNQAMQQVELPSHNVDKDTSRKSVIDIEVAALRIFIGMIDKDLLMNGWLLNLVDIELETEKTLALSCIRLVRTIIHNIESNNSVHFRLKTQTHWIRTKIQSILRYVVTNHLKSSLQSLLTVDNRVASPRRQVRTKRNFKREKIDKHSFRRANENQTDRISWEKLSRDIHQIDHDLVIHWSQAGLNSLDINDSEIFGISDFAKMNQLIKTMMNRYLAEKASA